MKDLIDVKYIVIYLIVINLITFLAMWLDKWKAKRGKWRIPENTLLVLVLLGGGIGGIAGMYTCRQKSQKAKFVIGFPVNLICEILFILLLCM